MNAQQFLEHWKQGEESEQKSQWRPARGDEWEKWRYKKSLMLARKFADAVGQTDEEKICLMAAQIAEDLAA